MAKLDDDVDGNEEAESSPKVNRKKILMILVPLLIVVAIAVSFLTIFNKNLSDGDSKHYNVVTKASSEGGPSKVLVFYDLPEILVQVKSAVSTVSTLKMKINIELERVEDTKTIEAIMPKITDIIIAHVVELTPDEINGVNGLYWLKEELLHRINLVTSPVVVSNLNFKAFELQTTNTTN